MPNRRFKAKGFHIRGERSWESLKEKEGSKGKFCSAIQLSSTQPAQCHLWPVVPQYKNKARYPKRQLKGNHTICTGHLFC